MVFGRPTLSRPVAALLARTDVEKALYLPRPVNWLEPGRRPETIISDIPALFDFAGSGADTYAVQQGSRASVEIIGFKASDHITLGGFTAADASSAVSKATTGSFGTMLNLSDGTTITLFGASITASQVSIS